MTLEDEAGLVNVIVRPEVYAAHRRAIRGSALLYVEGLVQRRHGNLNVVAQWVEKLLEDDSVVNYPRLEAVGL